MTKPQIAVFFWPGLNGEPDHWYIAGVPDSETSSAARHLTEPECRAIERAVNGWWDADAVKARYEELTGNTIAAVIPAGVAQATPEELADHAECISNFGGEYESGKHGQHRHEWLRTG